MDKIAEIEKLKSLLDAGALNQTQYDTLLTDLLGDVHPPLNQIPDTRQTASGSVQNQQPIINLPTIEIGGHQWVQDNLNITHFQNGDEIQKITSLEMWYEYHDKKLPGYCNPMFDEDDPIHEWGLIYNWHAVHDSRILAPNGYRHSNLNDWYDLFTHFDKAFNQDAMNGLIHGQNGFDLDSFSETFNVHFGSIEIDLKHDGLRWSKFYSDFFDLRHRIAGFLLKGNEGLPDGSITINFDTGTVQFTDDFLGGYVRCIKE